MSGLASIGVVLLIVFVVVIVVLVGRIITDMWSH